MASPMMTADHFWKHLGDGEAILTFNCALEEGEGGRPKISWIIVSRRHD